MSDPRNDDPVKRNTTNDRQPGTPGVGDLWLLAWTPDAVHVWSLGERHPDGAITAARVAAAKTLLAFPDGWEDAPWRPTPLTPAPGRNEIPSWDVLLSYGDPHPQVLALATVHDLSDLETS